MKIGTVLFRREWIPRIVAREGSFLVLLACAGLAQAADRRTVTVVVSPDQTIRQVAEKYLGDPDLWPEILKANGIGDVNDLQPGRSIQVPSDEIFAANRALERSQERIEEANKAGAQLFATDEIGKAVDLHETALARRLARQWGPARDLAVQSVSEASAALQIAQSKRDEPAQALLSDKQGEVEGRRPAELSWNSLAFRALLIEEQKVRTLSESTAQMTFRDASRLRLNANSNAVIKQMRYDLLTRKEEAKVTLVEGDFYGLLAGGSERKTFSVDIPDAKASVESGDFWVSSDKSGARFTNYDEKPVDITAGQEKLTLGRNEGAVVVPGQAVGRKRIVLDPPVPGGPDDEGLVLRSPVDITWSAPQGATAYWIEIGTDQAFETLVESHQDLKQPDYKATLPAGTYFWRVSAIDRFGLPGQRSPARRFTLRIDTVPPFLRIDEPAEGVILRSGAARVEGETLPGARVTVNGESVPVDAAGRWSTSIAAKPGENRLSVASVDAAGNRSEATRAFVLIPDANVSVRFEPGLARDAEGRFVTRTDAVTIGGTTIASSRIEVLGASGHRVAAVASDASGRFTVNVPAAGEEDLRLVATGPSGQSAEAAFRVAVDRQPPTIILDEDLPRLVADERLDLAGRLSKPASLTVDGKPVPVEQGAFSTSVLLSPGENTIELASADAIGNVDVQRYTVALYKDPPKLVSAKVLPGAGTGAAALAIEVAASDPAGLATTARSTVVAGSQSFDVYLRLGSNGLYSGVAPVPRGDAARARVGTVELTNNAGATRLYRLN